MGSIVIGIVWPKTLLRPLCRISGEMIVFTTFSGGFMARSEADVARILARQEEVFQSCEKFMKDRGFVWDEAKQDYLNKEGQTVSEYTPSKS